MTAAGRLARSILRMPDQRPALSVVLTGAIGALALAAGLVAMLGGGGSLPIGAVLGLAGLAILITAAHAGYRTEGLQRWHRVARGPRSVVDGHLVVRWLGPLGLLAVFGCCYAWLGLLVLTTHVIRAATSSHQG